MLHFVDQRPGVRLAGRPHINSPRHTHRRPVLYTTTQTLVASVLALCLGVWIGWLSTPTPVHEEPRILSELTSAYAFAAHCGGHVEVSPLYDGTSHEDGTFGRHDVVVVGCDR